jgi:hypothetical protein
MSMESLNEVRVKDEQIYDSQSYSDTKTVTSNNNLPNKITNNEKYIKQEKQFQIRDSKRTREDISIDDHPNKSKIQSIDSVIVKEEPKVDEFANKISIAFLNEETTTTRIDDSATSTITNQPTTNNADTNNPRIKKSK